MVRVRAPFLSRPCRRSISRTSYRTGFRMKKKPTLTILSSTSDTAAAIVAQLSAIFSDLVSYAIFDYKAVQAPPSRPFELALVTSPFIYDQAILRIPPGTEVITAERTVIIDTVHQLYDLPAGADVLLVNNLAATTLEAIRQLQAVGVTHLRYHPYYPGIDDYRRDCPFVVSFDETDLIPEGRYERICNLGSRPLDITTIMDIATRIGVYDRIKDVLSALYLKSFIEMSKSIHTQLRTNQYLREKQNFILNMFESGILTLNADSRLDFFNDRADKILKIREKNSPHLREIITRAASERMFFTTIGKNNYYVEVNRYSSESFTESIIVIGGTKKIESIEKDYRIYSLQKGFVADYTFDKIFSTSPVMKKLALQAKQFAKSDSNILIEGESGSGKEMFAQAIHNESDRRKYPFVAVNFAALSDSLSESELFGHEEGAFTGARKGGKKGLFEMAHNGTIFLDEIGDAPVSVQKKVLRVLQERQVMPVGSSQLIPVNVRVIAATNQNLWDMVLKKTFRQDLYYRLKVLPLHVPPLRERKADIVPTFLYFLERVFGVSGAKLEEVASSRAVRDILLGHQWPGNIRELRNVAEYVSNCIAFDTDWADNLNAMLYSAASGRLSPLTDLERLAPPGELMRVLHALNRPPHVFGRKDLEPVLAPMTQSTIKGYLAILKKAGLIQSRTGYGSYLLEAGKRLCLSGNDTGALP